MSTKATTTAASELAGLLISARPDTIHYADEDALSDYTDQLADWLETHDARPEVRFLLGFLEFQRGAFAAAHAAFSEAARGLPKDELTQEYLSLTKPPTEE